MKKQSRLSICIILSLALIVSMIPLGTAFAAEEGTLFISQQQESKTVCVVSTAREEKACSTLKEAFDAAGSWGTIKLTDDVETDTIAITGSNYITLELAGYKIKGTSKDGIVFEISNDAQFAIEGWEGHGEINGSIVIAGGRPSVSISSSDIANDVYSPIVVKREALYGATLQIMDGKISTKSEVHPAIKIESNIECSIWGEELASEGTGLAVYAGKVSLSGTNVTAKKTAVEINRTIKGSPITVDLGGGTFKAETALLERNGQGYSGSDNINIETNYSTFEGNIECDNLNGFIKEAFFNAAPDEANIDPAYEVFTQETNPTTYYTSRREEKAGLKSLMVRNMYEDGGFSEEGYYYKTFRGINFKDKLEQIKSEILTWGYESAEVIVDNDAPISAVIDEKIKLTANTVEGNNVTAADGCTLKKEESNGITVYTAESHPVQASNIKVSYIEKKIEGSEFLGLSANGALTGISASENGKIVEAVAAKKDDIIAELGINQSKLGKELSDAGIGFNKISDINVYIVTGIDTQITTKASTLEKIDEFGISAKPVYEVYATTAVSASEIVSSENVTGSKKLNAVKLSETTEFDFTKEISLKMPVPKEIALKSTDKVILKYYPDGNMSTQYFGISDCKISGSGNSTYLTFTAEEGIGDFSFGINKKICYTSVIDGTPRYFEYLTTVLSGESKGQTVYLTSEAKNLTEEEKTSYLTAYLYKEAKNIKIDKSAAPDVEFNILPYTGYAYYKSTKDNVDTYNVIDLATLKFKATSEVTKKGVKVTVVPKTESRTAFNKLLDQGYKAEYKFYRSEKKSSKYSARLTAKKNTYTNINGKKGKKYYYKAKVIITDPEGNACITTELKNCSYACRTWKK